MEKPWSRLLVRGKISGLRGWPNNQVNVGESSKDPILGETFLFEGKTSVARNGTRKIKFNATLVGGVAVVPLDGVEHNVRLCIPEERGSPTQHLRDGCVCDQQ